MIESTGKKTSFYSLIGLLNVAVAGMFYSINITPTPVLASPPPHIRRPVTAAIPATQGIPIRVEIPSLAIDLPVSIGSYSPEDASWTVDATRAYYANASVPVNNSNGTTLVYGHAQSTVFESLPQIQPGSEAIIYTDSGYAFRYRYTTVRQVVPEDTSVLTASGPPQLVLQTCTGTYSELRALYSFRLESIDIV